MVRGAVLQDTDETDVRKRGVEYGNNDNFCLASGLFQ